MGRNIYLSLFALGAAVPSAVIDLQLAFRK